MQTLFPDVIVNGETIPAAQVAAETQNHSGPSGKPGIAWRKAANAVAIRALLLQEARRRGIAAEPQEVGPGRFETPDEARIRALLEDAVHVGPPDDAALHAEWARDPGRFRSPPLWEVSHILVACAPQDKAERDAAHVRATEIAAMACNDPRQFAKLASELSDCGSRANGGALGQLGPGDSLPEFERALRQLEDGSVTPAPVLTRHGWHVIKMDAKAPGAVLPFETVRPKIAEAMEKAAWARAARDFVQSLVTAAEISGADLAPTPAGPSGPDSAPPVLRDRLPGNATRAT